ncbi:MAG: ABC transporter, ATP-binding protein [Candidatus Ozemobacter sibiricus]|jgi:ABC-2 type transport system ATP-binding protein|uniref:ABC transporter, ATP-binding protein n=1 Tax=Candidatus Ozemobacter sibiricus TaxID=2268124 RepID=A0A367ZN66_9BACT|nr:MAG: ABC transporter, ATP-binding protein [Candidatus Ozemobacter sibiricus]
MPPAIRVERLAKSFEGRQVVKEISFEVHPGEIFGFLGPNGAGKTTSIRMMIGELVPDAGEVVIAGLPMPAERDRLKSIIGVVPDHQNLYDRLTVRQNLDLFARLYQVPPQRVDELIDLVHLREHLDHPTVRLSRGLRQRTLIARGILHRPSVFFLDEPTSALDPHSAQVIRRLIRDLRDQGTTVFLTTHYMEEANSLCHRIAIMHQGTIVAIDTPAGLRMRFGRPTIRVTLKDAEAPVELPLNDPEGARTLAGFLAAGRVARLHSQEATLEEAFMRLTGAEWHEPDPGTESPAGGRATA